MRFCCSGTDFIRGRLGDNLFCHYSYPRLVFYCCIIALRMGWCLICFLVKETLASGVLAHLRVGGGAERAEQGGVGRAFPGGWVLLAGVTGVWLDALWHQFLG